MKGVAIILRVTYKNKLKVKHGNTINFGEPLQNIPHRTCSDTSSKQKVPNFKTQLWQSSSFVKLQVRIREKRCLERSMEIKYSR